MRSVTSYFNPTLFKKNLTGYWPLWVCCTAGWLLVLPVQLLNWWLQRERYHVGNIVHPVSDMLWECLNVPDWLQGSLVITVPYAALCAMAVFGYLYNHRAAATIHALPVRREELFVTNFLSGLTFCWLPTLITGLATALVEMSILSGEELTQSLRVLVIFVAGKMAMELFFFSFAAFCAMFTGHILALPAFYGILNALVLGMYSLVVTLGQEFFYGVSYRGDAPAWAIWLTPAYAMGEASRWICRSGEVFPKNAPPNYEAMHLVDPAVLVVYAVAALVLAGVSLLVYRQRHIETAGDVVSVKVVRPIFRAGVAICVGLAGGILLAALFGWANSHAVLLAGMVLCTAVGFFGAEMLLQKSFRVWTGKAWKGCLVLMAVMAAVGLTMELDLLGIESKVPETDKVESVQVWFNGSHPDDTGYSVNLIFEEPAQVEKIVNLHQAIVDDYAKTGQSYGGDDYHNIRVDYTLDGGGKLYRQYYSAPVRQNEIGIPGSVANQLDQFYNDPAINEAIYELDTMRKGKIVEAQLDNVLLNDSNTGALSDVVMEEGLEELWLAVQKDFAEGTLGKRWLFDNEERYANTYVTDLRLYFQVPTQQALYEAEIAATREWIEGVDLLDGYDLYSIRVTLTPNARHTLAVLEKYTALGEEFRLAKHDEQWTDPEYLEKYGY